MDPLTAVPAEDHVEHQQDGPRHHKHIRQVKDGELDKEHLDHIGDIPHHRSVNQVAHRPGQQQHQGKAAEGVAHPAQENGQDQQKGDQQ